MTVPARIILSRKGFDSKYGGCASPIFPDNSLVSLPIREEGNGVRYRDLAGPGDIPNFGCLVDRLRGSNVSSATGVHLDPDVRREMHRDRTRPWRPLFGQCDAAARHLKNKDVSPGDLFLFFGWFRKVDDNWKYKSLEPDVHALWGWLQIDHDFDPNETEPEWATHHPHCVKKDRKCNRIYVGRKSLTFDPRKPGAGVFGQYFPELCLTHPERDRQRSYWRLPSFFRDQLTYHPKTDWGLNDEQARVSFQSAKIGQEFVHRTENDGRVLSEWLQKLFARVPSCESY